MALFGKVWKASDTSRTSTTTLAVDPDLVITLAANKTYRVGIQLQWSGGGSNKYMLYANGATITRAPIAIMEQASFSTEPVQAVSFSSGASWRAAPDMTSYITSGSTVIGVGSGFLTSTMTAHSQDLLIVVGSTGGTLEVWWAQNSSSANATILKAGSYIEWDEVTLAPSGAQTCAKVKTGTTSRNSTTVVADDPDLLLNLSANSTYLVQWLFGTYAPNSAGTKMALAFTGTVTRFFSVQLGQQGQAGPLTQASSENTIAGIGSLVLGAATTIIGTATATDRGSIFGRGILVVGASGGDLKIQWAQQTSNASSTVAQPGSYLLAKRIA